MLSFHTKLDYAQRHLLNIKNQTEVFAFIHILLSPKTVQEWFHTNHSKDSSKLHSMRGVWEVWTEAWRCHTFRNSTQHPMQETHPVPESLYHGNFELACLHPSIVARDINAKGKKKSGFIRYDLTFSFQGGHLYFLNNSRGMSTNYQREHG